MEVFYQNLIVLFLSKQIKKKEIIRHLNRLVSESLDLKYAQNLLQAVHDFAHKALGRVTQLLNKVSVHGRPIPRKEAKIQPRNSTTNGLAGVQTHSEDTTLDKSLDYSGEFDSSSSSSDGLIGGQHSQEFPHDTYYGGEDSDYGTQTPPSLATFPSESNIFDKISPVKHLKDHTKTKHRPKMRPEAVNYYVTYHYGDSHYYSTAPSDSTYECTSTTLSSLQNSSQGSSSLLSGNISRLKRVLNECYLELTTCIDLETLLPHLKREQLVTTGESETLTNSNKTTTEKNQYLLSILPSKGESTFERFIKCLEGADEHLGHLPLATLLKSIK